ncbi:MAG: integration host factor subunit alpha [Proteobacteria bacterium]|nr:integration host factor subunit alpha [Pseudomonadota bacterium]MBU1716756.1 integration host factor subunit alpha [Pseudomonadota bacterium]
MEKSNLTRKELAKAINEKMGFSHQGAGALVDKVFDKLKKSLLDKEPIKLVQFGTFTVRNKESRIGRNPRTGETMEITKRSMVTFKPSKGLREKINK